MGVHVPIGALKQSDVGLALLSGYGDTNTTAEEDGLAKVPENESRMSSAEVSLNQSATALMTKASSAFLMHLSSAFLMHLSSAFLMEPQGKCTYLLT